MIEGVIIKNLKKFKDERGWLVEIFRDDETDFRLKMNYISMTHPGVVRGPHEHVSQSDLFVFIGPGEFRLYLWDNRKTSKTYKQEMQINGGEKNLISVVVPPGVVHGYKCISNCDGWCINLPDKLYAGKDKKEEVDEIRWEEKEDSPFKI